MKVGLYGATIVGTVNTITEQTIRYATNERLLSFVLILVTDEVCSLSHDEMILQYQGVKAGAAKGIDRVLRRKNNWLLYVK